MQKNTVPVQRQAKRAAMFQRQIQEQMAKIKGQGSVGHRFV